MTDQGEAGLEQLDSGDGQEQGGARHLRLVAVLAGLGLLGAYLLYGPEQRRASEIRPAPPAASGSAIAGPLPAVSAPASGAQSVDGDSPAAPAPVDALLLRPGAAGSGRSTLVRYGSGGVVNSRVLNGFVAPLFPGVAPVSFPLPDGDTGLAVGLWSGDSTRAAVLDTDLRDDPVPLREPAAPDGLTLLGTGAPGIWTTTGSSRSGSVWAVQLRQDAGAAPQQVPEPPDLAELAAVGDDVAVLGLLRAPGTKDYGVLVGVSTAGRPGVELRAEWPDGRATRAQVGALVALGPDYVVVADSGCPSGACGLSVLRLAESGAVVRQAVRVPSGWTYASTAPDGTIAFASDGFVLPLTAGADGASALAWVPARGGEASLVPGSAGLARRANGRVVAATGSVVVFSVAPPGSSTIRLAWWDSREAASARYLGGVQPDADLLAAVPR